MVMSGGSLVCIGITDMYIIDMSVPGCHGRVVRQADATPDRWVETVDRFWQYVSDLNEKADGVLQTIKTSQLNRELE